MKKSVIEEAAAAVAQGVINIAEGHTNVEHESRVHRGMSALVDAFSDGSLVVAKRVRVSREDFEHELEDRLRFLDRTVVAFQKRLAEDPSRAFEWADGTMRDVGERVSVIACLEAVTLPDSKATLETLRAHALERVLRHALYPQQSSSQSANLMNVYIARGWGRIVEQLAEVES